jgi:hypothetical protein
VSGTELVPTDRHAGATIIVDVTMNQNPLQLRTDAGSVVESDEAIVGDVFRTWLRWYGQRWTVVDWKRAVTE